MAAEAPWSDLPVRMDSGALERVGSEGLGHRRLPRWGAVSGASGMRWRNPVLVGSSLAIQLGWSAQEIAAA